jgi:hypothetical protein
LNNNFLCIFRLRGEKRRRGGEDEGEMGRKEEGKEGR